MAKEEGQKQNQGAKPAPAKPKPGEKQTHANVYAAFSALQGELKVLPKSAQVSFETRGGDKVEYKYTPLSEILSEDSLYPLLAKHGLSARHEIIQHGTKDAIVAILTHETAKWVETDEEVEDNFADAKKVTRTKKRILEGELRSGPVVISQGGEMKDTGAAITYARRYSLTMLLGLSTEEDKDAELLGQSAKNAQSYAFKRAKKGLDEAKDEKALDKAVGILTKDLETLNSGKAPSLGLPKDQYEQLLAHAEVRRRQMKEGISTPAGSTDGEEEGTID